MTMRMGPIVCVLFALGCGASSSTEAHTVPAPMSSYTQVFDGTIEMLTPDGATSIQPTSSSHIVRELDPAHGQIIETVTQGDEVHRAVLTRQGSTNIFDARDEAGSFSGTLTFEGPEWHWTSWVYNVTIEGGMTLVGTGHLEDGVLETEKVLSREGAPMMLLREHYTEVAPPPS